jgi:hypothetical protein
MNRFWKVFWRILGRWRPPPLPWLQENLRPYLDAAAVEGEYADGVAKFVSALRVAALGMWWSEHLGWRYPKLAAYHSENKKILGLGSTAARVYVLPDARGDVSPRRRKRLGRSPPTDGLGVSRHFDRELEGRQGPPQCFGAQPGGHSWARIPVDCENPLQTKGSTRRRAAEGFSTLCSLSFAVVDGSAVGPSSRS